MLHGLAKEMGLEMGRKQEIGVKTVLIHI